VVDCVEPNTATGTRWVYFGYVNDGAPVNIDFGTLNQVLPGFGFQGQPTVFNTGSYPRVLRAVWNQAVFTAVAWDLNNIQAIANEDTPFCASGATGPASDLSMTGATVHGLVNPKGTETDYHFDYGTTIGYGKSTPGQQVTSGSDGVLVSETLTGLEPATTYHYRLVSDGTVPTVGEDRTFTTNPLPPPPEPEAAAARFDLATAVKRCKRRFQRGSKGRKRCIQRAKRLAIWA
jgi:hypothetical protein